MFSSRVYEPNATTRIITQAHARVSFPDASAVSFVNGDIELSSSLLGGGGLGTVSKRGYVADFCDDGLVRVARYGAVHGGFPGIEGANLCFGAASAALHGSSGNNSTRFTPRQLVAIRSGAQEGLTLIVGPPGTGKTDVAAQLVAQLYLSRPGEKILLVAHSNAVLNRAFEDINTCLSCGGDER